MKIATVLGARPQFIKAAPVSRALARAGVGEVVIHTGQHYDANMSDVFFDELGMAPPARHLEIGSGPHGRQTGRMLERIEEALADERPAWVLVYGDTNSTLAGALAAVKMGIPVAHVEAGLRSFNRAMPEEHNRVLTDHLADMLFAPTAAAVAHLAREGMAPARVVLAGDVMYDAARLFAERARDRSPSDIVPGVERGRYCLATVHRAENTGSGPRLRAIFDGLAAAARTLPVVLPLHPRTRAALMAAGGVPAAPGLHILEPFGFLDMIALEREAAVIATDSGGVQKEAFFYGVPCVTLRDETEWVELLDLGWNRLAPPVSAAAVRDAILAAAGTRGRDAEPYGDGHAADRIAEVLGTPR